MKDTFQNWEIAECIGNGAFGKVYRIVRTEYGHTYEAALKVLEIPQHSSEVETIRREGMSEKDVTEYFESVVEDIVKEFALMSKLKGNSYVVSYEDHEVVRKEDSFGWEIYIRMELLTPLYTYMEQHPMTASDVIKIGIHLCKALELCERHHIIHRDIKPENIFISENGDFKLGDFGIARELEKTSGDLSKKGTKSYMAPEVYKGMEYNFSVDIYSLGIVLYRFLNNNRLPFYPAAPNPIRYSDKEEATRLRMCGKEMPKPCNASDELAAIVSKACAYHPTHRYGSAKEMREDLEAIAGGQISIGKSINTENGHDEDRTVVIFGEEDNCHTYCEASQEATVFLEREETEKHVEQPYIIDDRPTKKNVKIYAGIAVSCLCIVVAIFGMWAKIKSVKFGVMEQSVVSHIVSETSIIENVNLVPNTVEMKWEEAKKTLESIGLYVKVEKKYNSSIEKGLVIRQSLEAGTNVEEGEKIVLVVSKGEKTKSTPKPTVKPTSEPTEKPVWNSNQQTVTTPNNDSKQENATGNTTEEASEWQPNSNSTDENQAEKWNPDE